ncbi:MAG: polyprenyl synthetase family protein [Verrucomicrobiales bacterium]|nr:polyprenyl synthetase family protein [Verrucomicrobiales bacterium]
MLAADTKPVPEKAPWSSAPAPHGTMWAEISEPVAPFLADVRAFLDAQVATFEEEVTESARYALSASGKQLRPVLVALGAQCVGELHSNHVTGAAIVELVHLATLVHDDVLDAAGVRRRQPTVAARFGSQTAVLLGDCLFAHSLKLASGFPTPEVCRVVSAATKAVCSGEILQTLRQGRLDQPVERYFRVIQLKTAELFAASCELGGLLASAPPSRRTALRRFGLAFGTAYQVFDDCLDVFGNEASAGKTLGTDMATGKVTLPLLLAYQLAQAADRATLTRLFDRHVTGQAAGLRALLARYEIGARCREVMEAQLVQARDSLESMAGSPGAAALLSITRYLGQQVARLETT